MASAFAHAAAGAALTLALQPRGAPRRLWAVGAACAVLPDVDVIAFRFGIPYEHLLGHRGLSHSLVTAAALAAIATLVLSRGSTPDVARRRLWAALFVATASHGMLDALTTGGLGVALLAPFTAERYFFPFRPILVSPIGVRRFFTARGAAVLLNEALWVGLPSLSLAYLSFRRRRASATVSRSG
jgi:inner membrane protein